MTKQIIKTENAPAPIGPYNQAVKAGDTIYLSGQIALHPTTGELMTHNIEVETHQVMQNIKAILDACKISFEHVVKTTIFLSDMDLFAKVNEIYGSYFTGDYPARETVAVKTLPRNVHVEISMIAIQHL
ncbi:RidA family protein [Hydrotalea sandarakina]|jgi:2-iminobutanoate/2-iminopropanoate deaminase|uniref:2-iminobutanoate/2-iminopropanoate deaminase n=1 Tax=Hydrotalea sandarakina TaxID=1004304 RepID=A0A2W7RPN4_9BACT|nr:RidA family protein [Hydrotalea sandarakina]PZX62314.1 2-iminobutanoate/2-iminopropanoate deaminase [Hydrotalea sandarakina]